MDITVDPQWPIAYLLYSPRRPAGAIDIARDGSGVPQKCDRAADRMGVVIDVDVRDRIVGIEISSVDDPAQVALARDFAHAEGLAFPDDIRAVARVLA